MKWKCPACGSLTRKTCLSRKPPNAGSRNPKPVVYGCAACRRYLVLGKPETPLPGSAGERRSRKRGSGGRASETGGPAAVLRGARDGVLGVSRPIVADIPLPQ